MIITLHAIFEFESLKLKREFTDLHVDLQGHRQKCLVACDMSLTSLLWSFFVPMAISEFSFFFFLPLILFVLRNEWWVVLDLQRTKREQWSWPFNNGVWTGYCTRVPLCFPTCLHLSWHATDTRSTSPSLFSKLLPFFHNLALTLIGFLYIFMACDAMMLKSVKN